MSAFLNVVGRIIEVVFLLVIGGGIVIGAGLWLLSKMWETK